MVIWCGPVAIVLVAVTNVNVTIPSRLLPPGTVLVVTDVAIIVLIVRECRVLGRH